MENGVERGRTRKSEPARARAKDTLGAIALAEMRIADRIFVSGVELPAPNEPNAFGSEVTLERGDAPSLAGRLETALAQGQRATMIAPAAALAAARATLRTIAKHRLPAVVHALADHGSADALALADLGWGLLFASSVENSLDMALIARRAAEDCGTPFLVVHESGGLVGQAASGGGARHLEPLAPPTGDLCEVFIGPAASRVRKISDPPHPAHADVSERAFAERVPFALSSAMRELESLTGRRHDVLERIPAMDTQVVMVGMGELGESLFGAVERLRASGLDVGAVKLSAFRPFPGARLVKALSRALVVSVVEAVDQPLSQSNPLTRELKAAFADALTWAPDYPGIGRIPRVVSGVAHTGAHEIDAEDVDAIVHNMLSGDDRGKRSFVFGADPMHALDRAPHDAGVLPPAAQASRVFSMRGRLRDARTAEACAELGASVLHSALGLRARGSVRAASGDGDGFAFDLVASRERPRGVHAPPAIGFVALEDAALLMRNNPLARLAEGGVVALPTHQRSADGVWSELPPYAKAIVHDRHAHLIGFTPAAVEGVSPVHAPWLVAAVFVGLALASVSVGARPALDGSLVAREVAEALTAVLGPSNEALASTGGDVARAVFEASVVVPRATIERDEEAVRLGRRDSRAAPSR